MSGRSPWRPVMSPGARPPTGSAARPRPPRRGAHRPLLRRSGETSRGSFHPPGSTRITAVPQIRDVSGSEQRKRHEPEDGRSRLSARLGQQILYASGVPSGRSRALQLARSARCRHGERKWTAPSRRTTPCRSAHGHSPSRPIRRPTTEPQDEQPAPSWQGYQPEPTDYARHSDYSPNPPGTNGYSVRPAEHAPGHGTADYAAPPANPGEYQHPTQPVQYPPQPQHGEYQQPPAGYSVSPDDYSAPPAEPAAPPAGQAAPPAEQAAPAEHAAPPAEHAPMTNGYLPPPPPAPEGYTAPPQFVQPSPDVPAGAGMVPPRSDALPPAPGQAPDHASAAPQPPATGWSVTDYRGGAYTEPQPQPQPQPHSTGRIRPHRTQRIRPSRRIRTRTRPRRTGPWRLLRRPPLRRPARMRRRRGSRPAPPPSPKTCWCPT